MATSGTIAGAMTVRQCVDKAYTLIGVKAADTALSAEDAAEGLDSLRWMLKSWQADGVHLWRRQTVTMTWPAGEPLTDLDPQVMEFFSLRRVDSDLETPLRDVALEEWNRLPNKSESGTPLLFNVVKGAASMQLRVWPVPTEDVAMTADVGRVIETTTDLDETMDLPQEWTETVYYNLAARLADFAGKTGERVNRILARSESLYTQLRGNDRERTLTIRPRARYGSDYYGRC